MLRRSVPSLVLMLLVSSVAVGQTPSPIAVFDETTLRQAGVGTDAASLIKLLRDFTRNKGNTKEINALITQLGNTDFQERERASKDLIAIGRPALEMLRQARKTDPDPEVRRRAGHCLDAIESSLDSNVAFAAVRRLIHLRAAGAAEPLLAMLPDADWETQDEIFHGLHHIALRDGKLDPALLSALDDKSPLRRAAAALAVALAGTPADREHVRKRLTDPDTTVRLRAAQGLLAVHDWAAPASLPVLIALLNEPLVEISWSAEELLHWTAGDTAPVVAVGAASAVERQKAVAVWTDWHKTHAANIDWDQLDKTPRRPGLCFICDNSRVWLCGCDGKLRWTLPGNFGAHDIVLLPGNEILVSPMNGDGYLLKRTLDGKELWKTVERNSNDYVAIQRLPNGHFFLATEEGISEINAKGEPLSMHSFNDILNCGDAWKLRNGRVLCRHDDGVAEVDAFSGQVLRNGPVERACFSTTNKFAVLPDGRCVVADHRQNRLLEIDQRGQTIRALPIRGAWSVEALRNGNYLVSTMRDLRLIEVDPAGRTVWEAATKQRTTRIRVVLDEVRIGFDKPRPALKEAAKRSGQND